MARDSRVPRRRETPRLDAASIVASALGPAFATDERGRIRHWNTEAAELFGYGLEWARGRSLLRLLDPRDVHRNPFDGPRLQVWEMLARGEPVRPFEVSFRSSSGDRVRAHVSMVVVVEHASRQAPAAGEARTIGKETGELVYLVQPTYRRRLSDEVIERLLSREDWNAGQKGGRPGGAPRPAAEGASAPGCDEDPDLTRRQLEVLSLLASGRSSHEIAETLGVSIHTARSHLQAILSKLGAHSQVEAVALAHRKGLL